MLIPLVLILFSLLKSYLVSGLQNVIVNVDKHPIHVVDEDFLSVTIDSGSLKENFRHIDFESPRFLTLANGLNQKQKHSTIYLRFGGSAADDLIFLPNQLGNETKTFSQRQQVYKYNFKSFERLYRFASNMGWRIIFDLNSLVRNKDGTWDPKNAVELIMAINSHNFSVDYELGNEPDLYPTHRNITIPPEQLARDFKKLKTILTHLTHGKSKLYGPDMATLGRYGYFHKFLTNVEEGVLDAITFHHYYSASINVSVENFTSVHYLDTFIKYLTTALEIVDTSITKFLHPPIRIGETSSTYGGGNPDLGESFASGFLWLDKLGLAAQFNINAVMRQALKGGYYSLISKYYNPCVDYWTTVLYKQLVGTKVLRTTGFLQYNRTVRVYGHCVNEINERSYPTHNTIVLIVLNLRESEAAELVLPGALADKEADAFVFTPGEKEKGLISRLVQLNGQVLKMEDDEHLPDMEGVRVKQPFIIPPLSYGFYVVKNVDSVDC